MKMTGSKECLRMDVFASKQSDMKTAWADDDKDVETRSLSRQYLQLQEIGKFIRHLQIPMAIFGLFQLKTHDQTADKINKRIIVSKATWYNIVVLILAWAWLIIRCISFFVGDNSSQYTMVRVIPVAFAFQVAMNVTIMLKASHPRFGHSLDSCAIWTEKVMPVMNELNADLRTAKIKRRMLIVNIFGWMCISCNVMLVCFLLFYPHTSYYEILPEVMISPLPINIFTKCLVAVLMVYQSAAWILPMLYTIVLCTILEYGFKACYKAIEDANKDRKELNMFPNCMYSQRIMHLTICKVVETFDKDMKYLYASLFSTNIPLSCFCMYQIFKTEMDYISLVSYIFWVIFGLLALTVTCSFAAMLHKTAHSPLDCLYETGMKGISLDQIGQMNMFVSKLTAFPIGFTVLDFVVITKELILTVGGVFLTYSFVLLQF